MPVRREDVGASAGGQSWGLCQADEGVAAPRATPLFLAPLLALVHSAWLVRKRPESGGIGCCLRPTPTLRPHCPVCSSSDPTASGEALTRPYAGMGRRVTAKPLLTTYLANVGLEQKGDGPVPPSEPEPSRAAAPSPAFDKAPRMNVYLLPAEEISKRPGSGTPLPAIGRPRGRGRRAREKSAAARDPRAPRRAFCHGNPP